MATKEGPSSSKSRKRIKLECLKCGGRFNQDFRKEHERKQYSGRTVVVKHVGAPRDPFAAARTVAEKRKRESQVEEEPDTDEHIKNVSEVTPSPPLSIISSPIVPSNEPEP